MVIVLLIVLTRGYATAFGDVAGCSSTTTRRVVVVVFRHGVVRGHREEALPVISFSTFQGCQDLCFCRTLPTGI
jgi:hypothetical protein